MPKVHVPWPKSEMDRLVQRFFDREGIDNRRITGYRLDRRNDSITTIEVTMIFDDEPAQADVTGIDKPPGSEALPRVSTDNPNIVKEG